MRLQLSTPEGGTLLSHDEGRGGWMESSTDLEMEMTAVRECESMMLKCSQCGGMLLHSAR